MNLLSFTSNYNVATAIQRCTKISPKPRCSLAKIVRTRVPLSQPSLAPPTTRSKHKIECPLDIFRYLRHATHKVFRGFPEEWRRLQQRTLHSLQHTLQLLHFGAPRCLHRFRCLTLRDSVQANTQAQREHTQAAHTSPHSSPLKPYCG